MNNVHMKWGNFTTPPHIHHAFITHQLRLHQTLFHHANYSSYFYDDSLFNAPRQSGVANEANIGTIDSHSESNLDKRQVGKKVVEVKGRIKINEKKKLITKITFTAATRELVLNNSSKRLSSTPQRKHNQQHQLLTVATHTRTLPFVQFSWALCLSAGSIPAW